MRKTNTLNTVVSAAFVAALGFTLPAIAADEHSHAGHHAHGAQEHAGMSMQESTQDDMSMSDTIKGTVVAIDSSKRKVTIDHEMMPTIGMDAMTMGFNVAGGVEMAGLKKGDRIVFTVEMAAGTGLQITAINQAK